MRKFTTKDYNQLMIAMVIINVIVYFIVWQLGIFLTIVFGFSIYGILKKMKKMQDEEAAADLEFKKQYEADKQRKLDFQNTPEKITLKEGYEISKHIQERTAIYTMNYDIDSLCLERGDNIVIFHMPTEKNPAKSLVYYNAKPIGELFWDTEDRFLEQFGADYVLRGEILSIEMKNKKSGYTEDGEDEYNDETFVSIKIVIELPIITKIKSK